MITEDYKDMVSLKVNPIISGMLLLLGVIVYKWGYLEWFPSNCPGIPSGQYGIFIAIYNELDRGSLKGFLEQQRPDLQLSEKCKWYGYRNYYFYEYDKTPKPVISTSGVQEGFLITGFTDIPTALKAIKQIQSAVPSTKYVLESVESLGKEKRCAYPYIYTVDNKCAKDLERNYQPTIVPVQ